MFGYLNLGTPILIGKSEAQEANNCRVDQGYIQHAEWALQTHSGRSSKMGSVTTPSAEAVIDATYPAFGPVKWKYASTLGVADTLGMAKPASLPTIAAQAHGSQPYPTGDYTYAVSLYNPVTGEESVPELLTVTIGVNEVARFTNFPSYGATYPVKTSLKWRIYRNPLNSDQFLLVSESTVATSAVAGPVDDTVADDDLGEACDSFDNIYIGALGNANALAWHADKLFVVIGTVLYRSKKFQPWAFPNEYNSTVGEYMTGLFVSGEALVISALQSIHVLYGDDEDNFISKKTDSPVGIADNSAVSVAGALVCPITEYTSVRSDAVETALTITGISVFSGGNAVPVDGKIKPLFNRLGKVVGLTGHVEPLTGSKENRFYILNLNATILPVSTSEITNIPDVSSKIIFDIAARGFVTSDDGETFQWRSKEFEMPRDRNLRRIWIDAEGDFMVDVLVDGESAGADSFSHPTRDKTWANAPAWVGKYWSIRFVGQRNAKIYGYGVERA